MIQPRHGFTPALIPKPKPLKSFHIKVSQAHINPASHPAKNTISFLRSSMLLPLPSQHIPRCQGTSSKPIKQHSFILISIVPSELTIYMGSLSMG